MNSYQYPGQSFAFYSQPMMLLVSVYDVYYIIHLLDSTEPDFRFVVQIEADVGLSFASSNISLDLQNKSNVRLGSVQQMFYYAEITKW